MKVADTPSIINRIEQAFKTASSSTGTPFDYLLKTAVRESNLNAAAKAPTSSAAGLFQFIESTWLETMKEAGPGLGLQKYADHISKSASGKMTVDTPQMRAKILGMRHDPEVSAVMAGAFTRKNAAYLTEKLGRAPNQGELYIAHFLGAGGANKLISTAGADPNAIAAETFTAQAKANRGIFYKRDGEARTMSEVYANLVAKHGGGTPITTGTMTAYANAAPSANPLAGPANPSERVMQGWKATEPQAAFHGLFRNDPSAPIRQVTPGFWSALSNLREAILPPRDENSDSKSTAKTAAPKAQPVHGSIARSGPLDLTRFLTYARSAPPKDVLPPV